MDNRGFPQPLIDFIEAAAVIEVTQDAIHHAAAGMTVLLWRNSTTVETLAHAAGVWDDADMLPVNTRVTQLLREALTALSAHREADGAEVLLGTTSEMCELLPTEAMKDRLWDESHRKASLWGSVITEYGVGHVLGIFTSSHPGMSLSCNRDWWGHPDYPARVYALAAMNPPELETFVEGALNRPWALSDDQARFVVDLRYTASRIPD